MEDINKNKDKSVTNSKSGRKRKEHKDTLKIGGNVSPIYKANLMHGLDDHVSDARYKSFAEVNVNKKNLEYWVELPTDHKDYNLTFDPTLPTKRILKISSLAKLGIGVKYEDVKKLPIERQKEFFTWYQKEIEKTNAENLDVFLLQMKQSNLEDQYQTATEHLFKITNSDQSRQSEIDDFIRYYKNCKEKYDEARNLLQEKISELEAVKRKYQI